MTIPKELLDALMKDYKNPEDLIGETGLLKQLTKQLLERAMQVKMSEHLGHHKNAPVTNNVVLLFLSGLAAQLSLPVLILLIVAP